MKLEEREFYRRQMILPNFGEEGQLILKNSQVLVIGAGGLGSAVLPYLAAAGVGTIGICDFDRVEMSNLHRQVLYSQKSVGKFKVEVAKQKLHDLNPYIKWQIHKVKVDSDNILSIIKYYSVVVDCTDNLNTKFLIHDACYLNKKGLVQASIYQFDGQMQVFRFNHEDYQNKGCYRCLWPEIPSEDSVGTCQEVGVFGSVAGFFGVIQSIECLKLLLEWKQSLPYPHSLLYDLLSHEKQTIKWTKSKTCPLCGESPTLISCDPVFYQNRVSSNNIEVSCEEVQWQEFVLIDIRESYECTSLYFNLAQLDLNNKPFSKFNEWKNKLDPSKKYLFICPKGIRSQFVATQLREQGIKNCYSLFQGITTLKKSL